MGLLKHVCVVAVAGVLISAAHSLTVVGWSNARGGDSSLSSAAAYSSTRTALTTNFPGTTFTGVATLTAANLAGADVVWLGVAFGNSQAITPLSASEQTALLNFVLGGGKAMLFAENSSFSGGAVTANTSLLAPFGAAVTGTGSSASVHSFVSPTSSPATGPFGFVGNTVTSGYPGWFSTVPSSASIVANYTTNNLPTMLKIDAGALGAGSGKVWLLSDSGGQGAGGASGAAWNKLYSNMLAEPVPEPSTLAALALGALALVRRRRA